MVCGDMQAAFSALQIAATLGRHNRTFVESLEQYLDIIRAVQSRQP